MDNKNRMKQIGSVLKAATLSSVIAFVGVPLFAALTEGSPHATFVLLALVVCSYSTLYLR
jgi:hypothetical protein